MVPDIRDITADQSCPHLHCDRSHNFRRNTLGSSSSHHTSSCHSSANGCFCCDNNRHSCTPSPTCHFSCRCHSHHSMDCSHSCTSSSCYSAQDYQSREIKQCPRPGLSFRLFIRFWQWLWSFKLLGPSPSSDEDEWGGYSSNHYTIGLLSDCLTVTVQGGKRFKALINSGAALSLVHTSIYTMIGDHYKTNILPAAVHLKTVDGSAMSLLGKATLHVHIPNITFSQTFIICEKLPDRYFIWYR